MGRTIESKLLYDGHFDENSKYVEFQSSSFICAKNINLEKLQKKLSREYGFYIRTHKIYMEKCLHSGEKQYVLLDSDDMVSYFCYSVGDPSFQSHYLVMDVVIENDLHAGVHGESENASQNPYSFDFVIHEASEADQLHDIPDGFEYVRFLNVDCPRDSYYLKVENALYSSKTVLSKALNIYALKHNFVMVTKKSDNERLYVCCKGEPCSFFVRATRYLSTCGWIISDHCSKYNCDIGLITGRHPQARASVIVEYIKDFFRVGHGSFMHPIDVKNFMQSRHGIHINYMKAWRAREIVLNEIRGDPEESYRLVPQFCNVMVDKNIGSYVKYLLDEAGRFKYLFMSIGASMKGFSSCRPVISVDGTFMKSNYAGVLLTACTLDGNNQIFPLASAVVDSENDDSWEWFFFHLNIVYGHVPNLAIISDRHPSIRKAIEKQIPGCHYGYCMQHIAANIKVHFKKKGLHDLFKRCVEAYTEDEYDIYLNDLAVCEPKIIPYLNDIHPRMWSRAHFHGMRYNIMTTNICESYNAALLCARELPVIAALDEIRFKLQEWFNDRRYAASQLQSKLTPWADRILRRNVYFGSKMTVRQSNEQEYEVIDFDMVYKVNIAKQMCECRRWNMIKIPCTHACAAIVSKNLPPSNYVHRYYTVEALRCTYIGSVNPIGSKKQWQCPVEIGYIMVLPPDVKRPAGRPRTKRHVSAIEFAVTRRKKCSRCGGKGHNRKACRNAIRSYVDVSSSTGY